MRSFQNLMGKFSKGSSSEHGQPIYSCAREGTIISYVKDIRGVRNTRSIRLGMMGSLGLIVLLQLLELIGLLRFSKGCNNVNDQPLYYVIPLLPLLYVLPLPQIMVACLTAGVVAAMCMYVPPQSTVITSVVGPCVMAFFIGYTVATVSNNRNALSNLNTSLSFMHIIQCHIKPHKHMHFTSSTPLHIYSYSWSYTTRQSTPSSCAF